MSLAKDASDTLLAKAESTYDDYGNVTLQKSYMETDKAVETRNQYPDNWRLTQTEFKDVDGTWHTQSTITGSFGQRCLT